MADVKKLTVRRLAKALGIMVKDGHGRRFVAVHKDTLDTGNDAFNVCDLFKADMQTINICDGDGFLESNKDGSERLRCVLMLRGRWWDNVDHSGVDLLWREAERLEHEAKMIRNQIERLRQTEAATAQ